MAANQIEKRLPVRSDLVIEIRFQVSRDGREDVALPNKVIHDQSGRRLSRPTHDEGNAGAAFPDVTFITPQGPVGVASIGESSGHGEVFGAIVTAKNDHRVVRVSAVLEGGKNSTDAVIDFVQEVTVVKAY